jgi:pimeloyl-ACP methyl ester carboxylesterase
VPVKRGPANVPRRHEGYCTACPGFAISGTYLEPTAALLADRYPTYVPDLPGMGRSMRPAQPLDLPGLAAALVKYCDAVGIEKATMVGNSLGCPLIVEVASSFPDRIDKAVLVSPAGGPNNIPVRRALRQITQDGLREPPSMSTIAVRDYMRFGVMQGFRLFKAMTRYPTLERVANLVMPTLVVAGARDPLVRTDRVSVFAGLPHVDAVRVSGAHALNYSHPELIAELVDAHINGRALAAPPGSTATVELLEVPPLRPTS